MCSPGSRVGASVGFRRADLGGDPGEDLAGVVARLAATRAVKATLTFSVQRRHIGAASKPTSSQNTCDGPRMPLFRDSFSIRSRRISSSLSLLGPFDRADRRFRFRVSNARC
jgi:hypothetical protein